MMDRVLHRLRSEHGTSIVEVLAAALILIVISGAVTSMINSAHQASGQSKISSVAVDVAQTEIEELRAKPFSQLVSIDKTSDITSGPYTFSVSRKAQWAADADTSAAGCSSTANKPQAVRLTVTVTWSDMGARQPVKLQTLVAAPVSEETKGNYVVQIDDRDGNGVSGITVNLSGTATAAGVTDTSGCVRFTGLEQGPYTLSFARAGWVNEQHVTNISDPITVEGGETGSKAYNYSAGGGIAVQFQRQTTAGGAVENWAVPGVMYENATSSTAGARQNSNTVAIHAKPMWPALSQYGVHADTCVAAGAPATSVNVNPNVFPPYTPAPNPTLKVKLPQLHLALPQSSLPNPTQNTVVIEVTTQCGTTLKYQTPWTGTDGNYHWYAPVPPGTLATVCAYGQLDKWYWKRWTNYPVNKDATFSGNELAVSDLNAVSSSTNVADRCKW